MSIIDLIIELKFKSNLVLSTSFINLSRHLILINLNLIFWFIEIINNYNILSNLNAI
jgi:hypothetical protein